MAEFLVEVYVARGDRVTPREIGRAAYADSATGSVRCLRSILVPEDETCFLLYEGPSADAVRDACRRAGLRPDHVSAATSGPSSRVPTAPGGSTTTERLHP